MSTLRVAAEPASAGVADLAQRRLQESPYYFVQRLACQFDDGVLSLHGRVPNRQLKHFAEAIVSRVEGVRQVANWIEVYDPALPSDGQTVRSAG